MILIVYSVTGVLLLGLFRKIGVEEEDSNPILVVFLWPIPLFFLLVIKILGFVYDFGSMIGKKIGRIIP